MGININGGTDTIRYTNAAGQNLGCISFWMKSTQTTLSVPVSWWSSSSRNGIGFIFNDTANGLGNKIYGVGYDLFAPQKMSTGGVTTVNDGNWHHIALNWNLNNGGTNTCYVDGAVEGTPSNSSAAWNIGTGANAKPVLGDTEDAFWGTYVGDLAEFAIWNGRNLTTDEISALAKGFSPKLLTLHTPLHYSPLISNGNNIILANTTSTSGTSGATSHPRRVG